MGFSYGLTLVEALVFGAIISTTDTVRAAQHLLRVDAGRMAELLGLRVARTSCSGIRGSAQRLRALPPLSSQPPGAGWVSVGWLVCTTGQACAAASCTALNEAGGPWIAEGRQPRQHCHACRLMHTSQAGDFALRGAPLCRVALQVTIVAVLQKLGANEDLFALVFGESCLNDAVCFLAPRGPCAAHRMPWRTAQGKPSGPASLVRFKRTTPGPTEQRRLGSDICTLVLTLRNTSELRNSLMFAVPRQGGQARTKMHAAGWQGTVAR